MQRNARAPARSRRKRGRVGDVVRLIARPRVGERNRCEGAGGALTLVLGQVAFAVTRSSALRIAIATAFAVPAAVAGYHVVFAVSNIGVPSLAWREVFASLGAVCVGGTAMTRLVVLAKTRPFEPDVVVEKPS